MYDDEAIGDRVRDLIVTPQSIESLPRDMARAILARLAGLQAQVMLQAIGDDDSDVVLNADEAGALLGMSANFMLDRADSCPLSFKVGALCTFQKTRSCEMVL